jgi:hypothetical protein
MTRIGMDTGSVPLRSRFLGHKWLAIGQKTCLDASEWVLSGLDQWKLEWTRLVFEH